MTGYRIIGKDGLSVYLTDATGFEITHNRFVNFKTGDSIHSVFNFDLILGIVDLTIDDVQVRPAFDNTALVT